MFYFTKRKYINPTNDFELVIPDLKIVKGHFILIKGGNGSGKTTLAKILVGDIKTKDFFQNSIYLDQNTDQNIFFDLNFEEHLNLNKNSVLAELLYEQFPSLENLRKKYPDELSGGEKQLLAICTIITSDSEIYVLDEILNHLDIEKQTSIVRFIREFLIDIHSKTVLIIAHKKDSFEDFFDSTITIANGEIIIE